MLRSGAVDIAFASSPSDPGLNNWPCFATHTAFVAGRDYECDFDHPHTRQEIAQFPLILLERKASSRLFLEQEFLKAGVTLSPEIELSSISPPAAWICVPCGTSLPRLRLPPLWKWCAPARQSERGTPIMAQLSHL